MIDASISFPKNINYVSKGFRNILITGVGGGAGQSILKALTPTKHGLVGLDAEPLAVGLHAVPNAYRGYYANHPDYIEHVIEVCRKEKCGLIFPGHDVELRPLAENMERFLSEGIVPVVSSLDILDICDDKMATYSFLRDNGFPIPKTQNLSEFGDFTHPVVLKPRSGGARSKNTFVVRTEKEFEIYSQLVDADNCVVQEYIEGDEYTLGSVNMNDRCMGIISMRRILRDGDTYKAFVEHPSPFEPMVCSVLERLRPFGACNVQLRVRDGQPFIFEFNARCSGTTGARALAGFNEPAMIADYLLNNEMPTFNIQEISILRYWKEMVIDNSRIEKLEQNRYLSGDGTTL